MTRWSLREVRRKGLESLFRDDTRDFPPFRKFSTRVAQLVVMTWRKCIRDLVFERAASLAFMTTVSLVPAGILAFAVFRAVGAIGGADGFDESLTVLKEAIQQYTAEESREDVARQLDLLLLNMEQQSRGVEQAALFFLVITILSLYRSAERTFGCLWNVTVSRGFFRRLGSFWLLLTAAPLFLAGSVYARAVLERELGWAAHSVFPVAISVGAFTLLIVYLPNTRVRLSTALLGALVAAVGWQLATLGFSEYIKRAVLTGVYGALGVVPFFLLWVYMSWLIAILGSQLAYCMQHYSILEREIRFQLDHHRGTRPVLALLVLERVYLGMRQASTAPDAGSVAEEFGLPLSEIESATETLLAAGFLATDQDGGLTARRAPETVSPIQVMEAFPTGVGFRLPMAYRDRPPTPVAALIAAVSGDARKSLAGTTFAELLAGHPGGPATSG